MNRTELMELVNKREEIRQSTVTIMFDPSVPDEKRKKFLDAVDSASYYQGQECKAMELTWLWLKWVVLPTVIIFVAYCVYFKLKG